METKEKITCACGCGFMFDKFDSRNRERKFISGHNSGLRPKQRVTLVCKECGITYQVFPSKSGKQYCSQTCKYKACRRILQQRYSGRLYEEISGYLTISSPGHVLADNRGRVYYHRYIAWEAGLMTSAEQVVHHKDGNRQNNELSNLQVLSGQSEHMHLHHSQGLI
jgi:hypothetical protein